MIQKICLRRDTDDNFREKNPILLDGEVIYVKDKEAIKIGCGLPYNDTNFFYIKNNNASILKEIKNNMIGQLIGILSLAIGQIVLLAILIFNL